MDEEVVITRAYVFFFIISISVPLTQSCGSGGGCSANEDGAMRQSENQQSSSPAVKSFLNNKKYGVPVALIVGKVDPALMS